MTVTPPIERLVGRMRTKRSSAAVVGTPMCGLLLVAATGALAQSGLGGGYGAGTLFRNSAAAGTLSQARDGALDSGGRAFYLVPRLRASAELTNNVNLSATDTKSDLILGVTPGVRIGGQTGRVRGYLDYDLVASFYASQANKATFRNLLAAQVTAEAVSNWLFIDASARITQEEISPFGTQTTNPSLNNGNRTETSTVEVSPFVKGQLGGQVNYLGRAFYRYTSSGTSQASNSSAWGGLLSFESTTRWSKLGWGLDLSYREVRFKDNPRSEFDQLNVLSLTYAVTPELKVSLRGNVETSNLVSFENETTTGVGGGLRWSPSPRTNLVLEYDQRAFGSSHFYGFDYRTPRTVWSISSRQGLSTGQNFQSGRGVAGSPYELLFAQFATVEPDPVARAQLVNNLLQANGINPNAGVNNGFLPPSVSEELRQEASVALLGARSNLIFNVYQTQAKVLQSELLNPDNVFAGGNVIRWIGFGVNWSHRLTPISTLTLTVDNRQTDESVGTQNTNYWIGRAFWSNQLAERATLSVGARYQVQSGTTSYNEAALLAVLNMQF